MSSLLTIKGYNMGVRYRLAEDVTSIGRDDVCTIALNDPKVSRVHAEIRNTPDGFTVIDKGSTNGVFVNGTRVQAKTLSKEDEIRIGVTTFLFDTRLELQNALYSDNPVYITTAADETYQLRESRVEAGAHDTRSRAHFDVIQRVIDLVTSEQKQLPEITEGVLGAVVDLFKARAGVLMRFDSDTGKIVPLSVIAPDEDFAVNQPIIDRAVSQKKSILISGELPPGGEPTRSGLRDSEISIACVPIACHDECMGVLYIEAEGNRFDLRDLAVLEATGRLFSFSLWVCAQRDLYEIHNRPGRMIGESRPVQQIRADAARVAVYDTPILLSGETGTGKELLAREIHEISRRSRGPFVAVNCSAIPEALWESEVFGHEKGAFTGASQLTRGKVEMASGGTLFLDEIGEMSLATQPKLLRVLEEKVFYRVGGTRPIAAEVRVIAATNRDLDKLVKAGQFRSDLLYRLNTVQLHLPPLRERRRDIPLLVEHFLKRYSSEIRKPVPRLSGEAMALLVHFDWPGNIRELANSIERAILLSDKPLLTAEDFEPLLATRISTGDEEDSSLETVRSGDDPVEPVGEKLSDLERNRIRHALERNDWNQVQAADELGIHRNTLRRKIKRYGLRSSRS